MDTANANAPRRSPSWPSPRPPSSPIPRRWRAPSPAARSRWRGDRPPPAGSWRARSTAGCMGAARGHARARRPPAGRTGSRTSSSTRQPLRFNRAAPITDATGPAAKRRGAGGLRHLPDLAHTTSRLGVLVALTGAGVVLVAALAAAVLTRRGLELLRSLAAASRRDRGHRRSHAPVARAATRWTRSASSQECSTRMPSVAGHAREGERELLADASARAAHYGHGAAGRRRVRSPRHGAGRRGIGRAAPRHAAAGAFVGARCWRWSRWRKTQYRGSKPLRLRLPRPRDSGHWDPNAQSASRRPGRGDRQQRQRRAAPRAGQPHRG